MRILCIVGARPNFMKMAPLIEEIRKRGHEAILVHTGQHYDEEMSSVFFSELGLPSPDIYLDVGSGTHAIQTGRIMAEIEKVLMTNPPRPHPRRGRRQLHPRRFPRLDKIANTSRPCGGRLSFL